MIDFNELRGEILYDNPLASPKDVADFVLEGKAHISFPDGKMRLENAQSEELGQKANYVFWCEKVFPADFLLELDFRPLREPGLAMLFFAAAGREGQSLFDPALRERTGEYAQYGQIAEAFFEAADLKHGARSFLPDGPAAFRPSAARR